jgi:hypothetical protein
LLRLLSVLRASGLDCAVGSFDTGGEGDAYRGVEGYSGSLAFKIGLEMLCLLIEVLLEDRVEERLFPLIPSVSLLHETDLELLVVCVLFLVGLGGVMLPAGTRSSTSLRERLNLSTTSSPSMAAQLD